MEPSWATVSPQPTLGSSGRAKPSIDPCPQCTQSDPAAFPASRLREKGGNRLKVRHSPPSLPPKVPNSPEQPTDKVREAPTCAFAPCGRPGLALASSTLRKRKSCLFLDFQRALMLATRKEATWRLQRQLETLRRSFSMK